MHSRIYKPPQPSIIQPQPLPELGSRHLCKRKSGTRKSYPLQFWGHCSFRPNQRPEESQIRQNPGTGHKVKRSRRSTGCGLVTALPSTDLDADLKLRNVGGLLGRSCKTRSSKRNEQYASRKTKADLYTAKGRWNGCIRLRFRRLPVSRMAATATARQRSRGFAPIALLATGQGGVCSLSTVLRTVPYVQRYKIENDSQDSCPPN